MPLAGKRVLVTRARAQAAALSDLLRAAGAVPLECPVISIEPAHDYAALDAALRALDRYDWFIFTSVNAVTHVEQRLHSIGWSWQALSGLSVAAIGPKTAQELHERGINVSYVPGEYVSAAIAAGLPLRPGQRVLLARADIADKRLIQGLRTRGATVDEFVAYRTTLPDEHMAPVRAGLASGEIDVVTFASSSTVRNLVAALGAEAAMLLAGTVIACIGPVTAETAREAGLAPRVVAPEHTIEGLVVALEEFFLSQTQRTEISERLFAEARQYIPGGVNSPVRAFKAVGGTPRFIDHGAGPYLYDVDGNRYIDYVLSWGPLIAGHAHPAIVAALQAAAARGASYGAPTQLETELARRVCQAMPAIELVRFVSSGTEATMSALRLARAFTGREVIVKVEGGYHGHSDGLLARAGSGATTLGVPDSPGVPAAVAATTINLPFNDLAALEEALRAFEVAAFIVEPIPANMGVVPPAPGYLEGARRLTQEYGALLIFDEVITGFRVAYGGAQALYGIRPDLTCLGKIIGGGLPVGAYGGRRDVMALLAPAGPVYQAGTLSGNPLAMTAGIAMLDLLAAAGVYERLERLGALLHDGLMQAARRHDIAVYGTRAGSMGTLFFTPGPVTEYAAARAADTGAYGRFFSAMLERGVYLAPAQFEAAFVSLAHDEQDIETTLRAAEAAFGELRPLPPRHPSPAHREGTHPPGVRTPRALDRRLPRQPGDQSAMGWG